MKEFPQARGYPVAGKLHEIYLSDPRRIPPERLKTILRFPAKKRPVKRIGDGILIAETREPGPGSRATGHSLCAGRDIILLTRHDVWVSRDRAMGFSATGLRVPAGARCAIAAKCDEDLLRAQRRLLLQEAD
jgi:hypothetical protein